MQIKRKHLFGTTILAGVMAASAPAFAQSAPASAPAGQEAAQVEEVVVTGSRIRRDPTTAPTPLIQVAREELLETGLSTVIDYLATIPALSNSLVPSDTTGSGLNDGGLSFANLRTLGTGRTLTLVDGRRHVGSSAGSLSVDVDTVPRLLIESIEIVTGGASSVYGADAVAGVLNFKLRHDYEGAEIDANYAIINQDGNESKRISALVGHNFLDDRLNLYAFAEYEDIDEVKSLDIDWLRRDNVILGIDADPTAIANGPNNDGRLDTLLFQNGVRLDRPRWGSTTLANAQQPSPLNNPNVPVTNCLTTTAINSSACYSVDPAKTYWYEGTTARLANFGNRIGNTGANRPWNLGGDGESGAEFSTGSRVPHSESARYQVGGTFDIFSNVTAYAEAKYVKERTSDTAQPTFFDVFLTDSPSFTAANTNNFIIGTSSFVMRYSDNAFLPANVKAAIATNFVTNYSNPTLTAAGAANPATSAIIAQADHRMFGPDRIQNNERDLKRFVLAFNGDLGDIGFVHGLNWDLSGTYGQMDNVNEENGVDVERFNFAADSVVDTAGVLGTPGAIVCRVKLLKAQNVPSLNLFDYVRSGTTFGGVARGNIDVRDTAAGRAAIDTCQPLNIFGKGNQSQAGLDYVHAAINVREQNTQTDIIGSVSGQLWDFFGAGPMGLALGGEYRKETTKGIGRSADTGDRFLFLNTGPDFPEASYTSNEAFAELSLPLLRDSWLGEYAELSGSYRYADYSTVGKTEVYGVNLIYRPIHDIAFKSSLNTSIRVPSLGENFSPYSQTFANGFVDPCSTASITAPTLAADIRANRIANCTALAAAKGLSYDFGGTTADLTDDYTPQYLSGVAGVNGGNPFLKPETSNSFTFSTVIQPRFIPNFSLVLDYYEIQIDDVIQSVTAPVVAANCVNGPTLNAAACSTIFRRVAAVAGTDSNSRSEAFKVGAPTGDPIGGFIQGSINYAKRTVRGLDFTTRYSFDTEEMLGHNWGTFTHQLQGSWLIEQKNFTDIANPGVFTDLSGGVFFPRVRFTSRLTWAPVDSVRITWTTDWQSSQTITPVRSFILNNDSSPIEYTTTGNFMRNDLTVRWDLTDDVTLRAGVTNIFDAEQAPWLGTTLDSNFDPYGRRYNIGLNYKFQ